MTSTVTDAGPARKAPTTNGHVSPLPAYAENLATALARHVTRWRAELEAERVDHERDVSALREALHASVGALYHTRMECDRVKGELLRERDENRRLRELLIRRESIAA